MFGVGERVVEQGRNLPDEPACEVDFENYPPIDANKSLLPAIKSLGKVVVRDLKDDNSLSKVLGWESV